MCPNLLLCGKQGHKFVTFGSQIWFYNFYQIISIAAFFAQVLAFSRPIPDTKLQIWNRRWSLTAINSYIASKADLNNWTGLDIPINYVEQKSNGWVLCFNGLKPICLQWSPCLSRYSYKRLKVLTAGFFVPEYSGWGHVPLKGCDILKSGHC